VQRRRAARSLDLPSADGAEAEIRRVVSIFRELRASPRTAASLKTLPGTLSTAEAIRWSPTGSLWPPTSARLRAGDVAAASGASS
jgi:hypothetical protein